LDTCMPFRFTMLSSSISTRDGTSFASCVISKRACYQLKPIQLVGLSTCGDVSTFAFATPRRPQVAPVISSACTGHTGAWRVRSANQYIRVCKIFSNYLLLAMA
jgi:hypothetical protein